MSNRHEVERICKSVMAQYQEGHRPGMIFVAIVSESDLEDGRLEVDAATKAGNCRTEAAGAVIMEFCHRLQEAFRQIGEDIGSHFGVEVVDRPDLNMEVAGERPKA